MATNSPTFTLLNTRPTPMGEQLTSLCQREGITCLSAPMIQTDPLSVTLPEAFQTELNDPNIIWLFVSRTAVNAFAELLSQTGLKFQPAGPVIAVGPGSRTQLARQFSLPVDEIICPEDANSESLITLPQMNDASLKKAWLIKGEGGRALIQAHLTTRNVPLEIINLYRRENIHYNERDIDTWQGVDMILATSVDIASALLQNAEAGANPKTNTTAKNQVAPGLTDKPWLVFSDRIKRYLVDQGVPDGRIFICEQTDNSSIISNIKRMAK